MYLYCRATVVSKVFENKTDTVDKYYGTPYSISKIPPEVLNVTIVMFYILWHTFKQNRIFCCVLYLGVAAR